MGFCCFFSEPVDTVCGREGKKGQLPNKVFLLLRPEEGTEV